MEVLSKLVLNVMKVLKFQQWLEKKSYVGIIVQTNLVVSVQLDSVMIMNIMDYMIMILLFILHN